MLGAAAAVHEGRPRRAARRLKCRSIGSRVAGGVSTPCVYSREYTLWNGSKAITYNIAQLSFERWSEVRVYRGRRRGAGEQAQRRARKSLFAVSCKTYCTVQ